MKFYMLITNFLHFVLSKANFITFAGIVLFRLVGLNHFFLKLNFDRLDLVFYFTQSKINLDIQTVKTLFLKLISKYSLFFDGGYFLVVLFYYFQQLFSFLGWCQHIARLLQQLVTFQLNAVKLLQQIQRFHFDARHANFLKKG